MNSSALYNALLVVGMVSAGIMAVLAWVTWGAAERDGLQVDRRWVRYYASLVTILALTAAVRLAFQ